MVLKTSFLLFDAKYNQKERGPEPRPLLQATILFHLRGRLEYLLNKFVTVKGEARMIKGESSGSY